ncbi:SGNH/GDSL hydrolase family protein [Aliinostoc sp. HNIBRCY26]|uniref:SGNH/GDSL hydrolase family protein n=1 Tax=Aliinostoc sp. HNIBRCY26 TaxID=3418997 RepID=UPI003D053A96
MKTNFVAAGFITLSMMLPLKASAANFTGLYVFGDSLADTGNIFNFTSNVLQPPTPTPPSPPYFQGRFSNNLIWVDYLGEKLGLQPTLASNILLNNAAPTQGINFATGGANSGFGNAIAPNAPLPGVLEQVTGFIQGNGNIVDPNALYAVVGGANDYLFPKVPSNPNQPKPYNNIFQSVDSLVKAGAKNIVVFNLPDLGVLPGSTIPGRNPQLLTQETQEFNTNLAKDLATIRQNPNIKLTEVDVYSLFNSWRKSPEKFGFTNVTDACLRFTSSTTYITCNNPQEYLFWDSIHPSSQAHKLIADAVFVPEPSVTMGMLGLGAVVTLGLFQRQSRKSTSATK